jgi:hypothetical protein
MSSLVTSTFVTAMDKHTPMQLGENLHGEYGWSNDVKERIVQLSFQLVRTTPKNARKMASQMYALALQCKNKAGADQELTDILRRLILSTRDVEVGKGEWALSYELIKSWYQVYPEEAKKMIKYLVTELPLEGEGAAARHPYGSWKDIKQLWRVFGGPQCPSDMLNYLVSLINTQLRTDMPKVSDTQSLCAKWVPREGAGKKSQIPFKPFYQALAEDYFSHYLATAKTPAARIGAQRKAYMHYRDSVLVPLNKRLSTVEVRQCSNQYSLIDFKHVPSVAMKKQTKAFLNINKKGEERCDTEDRRLCALRFKNFIEKCEKGEEKMKGKRVGLVDFISPWIDNVGGYVSEGEMRVLNAQWENAGKSISKLGNFIAMVDTSGSMAGDPMLAAIGLGLRVAEKSRLGRRVMTFSQTPHWVNFEETSSLSEMMGVVKAYQSDWGMNTNFTVAMKMILDVCVTNEIPPDEVQDMVLAVFSDMQIDAQGNESLTLTMWDHITQLYSDAGFNSIFGEPYKPPHILFWNLKHTSGFPVLSDQKGATMFSGFSPALLNNFAEKGMDALKDSDPWTMLKQQLSHPRYDLARFD